jgi:yecA family protein
MPENTASLAELAGWLADAKRPANTLSLEQLYGFLFAVCSTPTPLKPSDWMPAVFADQLREVTDADHYLNSIIQLQQTIGQDIKDFLVALPPACELTEPFAANFESNALHRWSRGFELGLTLTEHFWDDCKTAARPQSYWAMLSFFSNLHNAQTMTAKFKNGSLPIEMVTRYVFSEFNKLLQDYADLAQKHMQPRKTSKINITSSDIKNSAGIPIMSNSQPMQDSSNLIQQAWASPDPVEKVQLAHQVLEQDPDNINALMLIAQWEAGSSRERRDLLRRAVAGCERALGEAFFEKNTGRFWLIRETRTFMEALTNLASSYAHLQDYDNAIACYERGITLNPADNQYNRYPLNNCYITTRQFTKAHTLAEQFKHDGGAFFLFDNALIAFIEQGDCAASQALKARALTHNKYVPKLLTGKIKMPKRMPDRLGSADKDEAVLYAAQNTELWRRFPGSISWLLKS